MRTKFLSAIFISTKSTIAFTIIGISFCLAPFAQATTINFDNLVYTPSTDTDFDCFCDHPLTNEYLSQGLQIYDGYLATYENYQRPAAIVSSPNFLLGGPYLRLDFVGALPTSVSMYVSAAFEDAIFVNAVGPSGFNSLIQTLGYAGPPDDISYVDKQFVSFYSATGISNITLNSYYSMRVGAFVDDLKFEHASLPEPSSLILLFSGLVILLARRLRSY